MAHLKKAYQMDQLDLILFKKKNGPTTASFSFIFGLSQTNIITIFTTD